LAQQKTAATSPSLEVSAPKHVFCFPQFVSRLVEIGTPSTQMSEWDLRFAFKHLLREESRFQDGNTDFKAGESSESLGSSTNHISL
jgi:hypothetical protein